MLLMRILKQNRYYISPLLYKKVINEKILFYQLTIKTKA